MKLHKATFINAVLATFVAASTAMAAGSESAFNPIDRQIGGTCHIFSAVALFEAACFNKTGKHVHVSQAFLYVQHLKEQFLNKSPSTYSQRNTAVGRQMMNWTLENNAPLVPQSSGDITGMDGGNPMTSLDRLTNGQASIGASEFPFSDEFQKKIKGLVAAFGNKEVEQINAAGEKARNKTISVKEAVAEQEKARFATRDKAYDRLRMQMPNAFDGVLKESPDIVECVEAGIEFEEIETSLTPDQVQTYVEAGSPVLCSLMMDYGIGGRGMHALIIEKVQTDKKGDRKFIVRDSNASAPGPLTTFGGCTSAIIAK